MAVAAQLEMLPAAERIDHDPANAHAAFSTIARLMTSVSRNIVRSGRLFRLTVGRASGSDQPSSFSWSNVQ
jgi:hypothetical protein